MSNITENNVSDSEMLAILRARLDKRVKELGLKPTLKQRLQRAWQAGWNEFKYPRL